MRIWFDVDGVLAKFPERFLQVVHEVTGRQYTLEDVTCFDFDRCIVSPEENRACWGLIGRTRGLVENLEVHEDWLSLAETFRRGGHFVGALTAPAHVDFWVPERIRWLEKCGFGKQQIVFASDKGSVHGDLLIDDKPDNCYDFGYTKAVLVDRPWNRNHLGIRRVFAPEDV